MPNNKFQDRLLKNVGGYFEVTEMIRPDDKASVIIIKFQNIYESENVPPMASASDYEEAGVRCVNRLMRRIVHHVNESITK